MEEDFDEFNINHDTGLPLTPDDVVPRVTSLEDFELCRAVKDKGKMTGEFQVIDANDVELKMSGLSGWEVLFVQFRDKKSGEFLLSDLGLPLQILLNFVDLSLVFLSFCNKLAVLNPVVAIPLRTFRPSHACEVYTTAHRR